MKKKIERIPKKVIAKQSLSKTSIVSGRENPASVKCVFYMLENGDMATKFTLTKWHEGHEGIGHGGIIYAILDEVMGRSNVAYDYMKGIEYTPVVTGEITVRNIAVAPVGETLYAYGRVVREEGRKHFTTSEMVKEDGTVIATGKAIFIQIHDEEYKDIEILSDPLTDEDPKEL